MFGNDRSFSMRRIAALTRNGVMNEGFVSDRAGPARHARDRGGCHGRKRPRILEFTGGRYHVAHVSTAGTVELVRAGQGAGLQASCEVTPASFHADRRSGPRLRHEHQDEPPASHPRRRRGAQRRTPQTAPSMPSPPTTRPTLSTKNRWSTNRPRSGSWGWRPPSGSRSPSW